MPYGNVPPIAHMIPPEVVCEAIARGLHKLRHESDPIIRRTLANRLYYASEPVWAVEHLMRLEKR